MAVSDEVYERKLDYVLEQMNEGYMVCAESTSFCIAENFIASSWQDKVIEKKDIFYRDNFVDHEAVEEFLQDVQTAVDWADSPVKYTELTHDAVTAGSVTQAATGILMVVGEHVDFPDGCVFDGLIVVRCASLRIAGGSNSSFRGKMLVLPEWGAKSSSLMVDIRGGFVNASSLNIKRKKSRLLSGMLAVFVELNPWEAALLTSFLDIYFEARGVNEEAGFRFGIVATGWYDDTKASFSRRNYRYKMRIVRNVRFSRAPIIVGPFAPDYSPDNVLEHKYQGLFPWWRPEGLNTSPVVTTSDIQALVGTLTPVFAAQDRVFVSVTRSHSPAAEEFTASDAVSYWRLDWASSRDFGTRYHVTINSSGFWSSEEAPWDFDSVSSSVPAGAATVALEGRGSMFSDFTKEQILGIAQTIIDFIEQSPLANKDVIRPLNYDAVVPISKVDEYVWAWEPIP